jgi:hypothetical protein
MPDTNVTTPAEIISVSATPQVAPADQAKTGKACGFGFERLSGFMAS